MKLPKFLNSLQAIMIPMLILITGFWIDASVLFYRAFDTALPEPLRYPAATFLGLAVALPLLLTAINNPILPGIQIGTKKIGFPELFGIFTVLMVLMFFDVFSPELDRPTSWHYLVYFLALFLGLIDYLYAYLYVNKYKLSLTDWRGAWFSLARRFIEQKRKLKDAQMMLIESDTSLEKAVKMLNEYREQFICKHCEGKEQSPKEKKIIGSFRNHVNRCPLNPKNQ